MKNCRIIHIIPHTHWDREWYVPFQNFRFRLVKAIDKLLEMTDRIPDYHFNMDGQSVVLEDYLEINPEKREKLSEKIKNGQIGIGPWYVQSSPWLQTAEGLIRNLKIGIDICKSFGVDPVDNGYVPDQFLHPKQMPQILNGFEIHNYAFSRGMANQEDEFGIKSEFIWEGPDGSKLLTFHLREGYGTCANLPEQPDIALNSCVMDISAINRMEWSTGLRLGFAGSDHSEPQDVFLEAKELFNEDEELTEEFGTIELSSWKKFIADLKELLENNMIVLRTAKGEFWGRKYSVSFHGVFSSRIHVKKRSFYLHNLLNYYSEPYSALLYSLGELSSNSKLYNQKAKHRPFGVLTEYPHGYLTTAWKYLLKNQAHDSSWTASMAQIIKDMIYRFDQCELIADEVFRRSAQIIVQNIEEPSRLKGKPYNMIVVFNPLPFKRSGFVLVRVDNKQKDKRPIIRDSEGKLMEAKFEGTISNSEDRFTRRMYVPSHGSMATEYYIVQFKAKSVPGLGYSSYIVEYVDKKEDLDEEFQSLQESFVLTTPNSMENDAISITFNENGSFFMFDKTTKKRTLDLLLFEDISDGGDGWEFKPIENDKPIIFKDSQATISVFEANDGFTTFKVDLPIKIPALIDFENLKRSNELVEMNISSYITLHSGFSRMVQIRTEFVNMAKDHRLRVLFPAQVQAKNSVVAGMFTLTERPIDPPKSDKWHFKPEMHFPHQYFFHIYDQEKKEGLAILSKGLFEYEIYNNKEQGVQTPALTLLRANGKWGRHLGMGKGIDIPDAQLYGMHVVSDYAVVFLADEQSDFEFALYQMALNFNLPLRAEENFDSFRFNVPLNQRKLPPTFGFCSLKGKGILYSSCYKPKSKKGIAIRLYNITGETQEATIALHKYFERANFVNLLDEYLDVTQIQNEKMAFESDKAEDISKVKFNALPYKIYTLLFE